MILALTQNMEISCLRFLHVTMIYPLLKKVEEDLLLLQDL